MSVCRFAASGITHASVQPGQLNVLQLRGPTFGKRRIEMLAGGTERLSSQFLFARQTFGMLATDLAQPIFVVGIAVDWRSVSSTNPA